MARELECKWKADGAAFAAIRAEYTGFTPIRMETTYFDTPDGFLSTLRRTLRCRMENDRAVYALKTYLPDGSHGEWETEAESLHQALELLAAAGAPELPAASELIAICGARFTRHCLLLTIPGGKAELALDEGTLLGGDRQEALREVELELKEGSDQALFAFANDFAAKYALETEPKSKFARARALLQQKI